MARPFWLTLGLRPITGASHQDRRWGARLSGVGRDAWTNIRTRHLWLYTPRGARFVRMSWEVARG